MADFVTIQNDLTTLLATTLTAAGVTLVGENTQDSGAPRALSVEWAEVRVLDASRLTELGSRIAKHKGLMLVELYTQLGKASARPRAIANAITNAFQGQRIGAASCQEGEFRPGARDEGDAYWHSGYSLRFHWEHTPT